MIKRRAVWNSLLTAIRQRHLDDCLAILRDTRPDRLTASAFAAAGLRNDRRAQRLSLPHRAMLDEALRSDEREYLDYYVTAIAHYYRRAPNPADHVAALVMSDAIDGVIHMQRDAAP